MKTISTTLSALLLCATAACAAPQTRFISHRGESMTCPENTLTAFRAAAERGADGFECDIYLTKDNEIVCLHDGTAKRTGGLDVKPRDATLAELRALDAGAWKGPQFAGERMPTLSETLALARDGAEIYVEIKCGAEILPRLSEVMAAEPKATPERVLFICFDTNVVAAVRERFPTHRAYWLTGTGPKKDGQPGPTAAAIVERARACRASGVDAQDSADITPDFVEALRSAGLSVHVWTVNHAPRARALAAMGVETITTDCGAALKAALYGGPADGRPVIHWTFDGAATNSGAGGARFDPVLSGKPAYGEGALGQGLRLDGVDDVASVRYQLCEQGTLALWWKPDAFYNFNTVIDNDVSPDCWEMWAYRDGRLRFRIAGGTGDVACDLNTLGGAGHWYHLAVVWDVVDAGEVRLYVNGVERSVAPAKRLGKVGGTLHLGGGNARNTRGKGAVDDVRVYGVALAKAQLRALAAARGDGTRGVAAVAWLQQTLAADSRTPTLVMGHYPFYSSRGETSCGCRLGEPLVWNAEVLALLEAAPNVVATLNGHMHDNAVDTRDGLDCLQNAAFAEWPNLYRVMRVYADRIEWEVRQVHNRGLISEGFLPEKALAWMITTREGDLGGSVKLAARK